MAPIGRTGCRPNASYVLPEAPLAPLDFLVRRIRAEYEEMPGLCLTFPQACRLWQVDAAMCQRVLDILVGENFLARRKDGSFIAIQASAPRPVKATLRPLASVPALRRSA